MAAGRFPDAGITGSPAGLGMSVSVESPTHPGISEVNRTVQSELGTMWRGRQQAADFE